MAPLAALVDGGGGGGAAARACSCSGAATVLLHLNATRSLKLAGRHALPLPRGSLATAEMAHVASLVAALSAPSLDVTRVACAALASLVGAHTSNREKLATRHCCGQLVALAQAEIVPLHRSALRVLGGLALHVGSKEELLAEGALQLLLEMFERSLSIPAGSPRLRPLQMLRAQCSRQLAAHALANLCEMHLAVQRTVVEHGGLGTVVPPLRRHNAAAARAAAAADGAAPSAVAAEEDEALQHALLDPPSRRQLLRCIAHLSLNEANHAAVLESGYLAELPALAAAAGKSEAVWLALCVANLAPNAETHDALAAEPVLLAVVQMLRGGTGGGGAAAAAEAETAAVVEDAGRAAVSADDEQFTMRWDEEEEEEEWVPDDADDGGSGGTADVAPAQLLLLQALAELSAAEATHGALVSCGVVGALLPIAEAPKTNASEKMEAVVALANLAENPATHDDAFGGDDGARAFALFVRLLKEESSELQREGFRALSCLAINKGGATAGAGSAVDDTLLQLLLQKARRAAARPTTTRWRSTPRAPRPVVAAAQPPQDRRRCLPPAYQGAPRRHRRAGRGGDGDRQRDLCALEVQFVRRDGAFTYCCTSARRRCSSCRLPPPVRSPTCRRSTTSRDARRGVEQLYYCTTPGRPTSSGGDAALATSAMRLIGLLAAAPRRCSSTRRVGDVCKHGRRQRRAQREVARALANIAASSANPTS